jgi:hypothetical protein
MDQRGKLERFMHVLSEQRRLLVAAGCDPSLADDYAALIRFLRRARPEELRRIFSGERAAEHARAATAERPQAELANMSTSELERLVNDGSTPRKLLERLAILRFNVPRGSMRSFSNREALVEKLLTLLRNEQAHVAIETVARRQGELPGVSGKK